MLGIYIAVLLWITILSRIGTEAISSYPPFWSFGEIISGNTRVLIETIENIIMFIPLGLLLRRLFGFKRVHVILFGFLASLLIECSQWLSHLGSFEVDDLITNTIGAVIGSLVPRGIQRGVGKKIIAVVLISLSLVLPVPLVYESIHHQHMVILASNGDRNDGAKNLLVLNGKSGYVEPTNVYVKYLNEGGISISGSSDARAWKIIGDVELLEGKYSFSGLTGVEEETIAIELEYYDTIQQKYIRLTPDIGPIDETYFTLDSETKIRAYVGVYSGAEGECKAFPVIYRED